MGKGLQSIVSAWTRINRDNEEQGYPNGIPEHLLQQQQQGGQVGSIQYVATGQPISTLQQQQQHQLGIVGQQLGPLEARSAAPPPPPSDNTSTAIAGGVISQGAIDPRTTTYKHASPQLSIHSGSSLSTFSFAAAKNNGQLTSGSIADTTLNSTPPSIREQLVQQHGTSAISSTAAAVQNLQPGILHQRYQLHNNTGDVQLQPPPQLLTSSTQLASQLAAAHHQQQLNQQQAQSSGANLSVSHSSKSSSQQSQVSPTSRRRGSSSASSNSRISNRSNAAASAKYNSVGSNSALYNQLESYNNNNNNNQQQQQIIGNRGLIRSSSSRSSPSSTGGIQKTSGVGGLILRSNTSSTTQIDHTLPPPPLPQAGADAILSRRKSNSSSSNLFNTNNSSTSQSSASLLQQQLGEPPTSLSSPNRRRLEGGSGGAGGALARSPSSSLWHSQRSISSRDGANNTGGGDSSSRSGAESVTSSLDKINNMRVGSSGMSSGNSATMEELNASANHALQSMNRLTMNQQQLLLGKTPPQNNRTSKKKSPQNYNTSAITTATASSSSSVRSSSSVPIPGSSSASSTTSRRKLQRKKSRTDLVREMASDRSSYQKLESYHSRHNVTRSSRSGISGLTSLDRTASGGTKLSKSSNSSGDDLVSNASNLSALRNQASLLKSKSSPPQKLDSVTSHKSPLQIPKQLSHHHFETRRNMPDFIHDTMNMSIREENEKELSSSNENESSTVEQQQQQQKQQQQFLPGNNTSSLLSESLYSNNHAPYSASLGQDPLDRRFGYDHLKSTNPGSHYMQDFYSNQLTSQRRSSTSSGTAIASNRSLEIQQQQQQQGVGDMTTLPENSVEVSDAVNNNIETAASPKQQQQQSNCSGCDRCMKMESTVLSLQADVEYLRALALEVEGGGDNNNSANLNNRRNQLGTTSSSIKKTPYIRANSGVSVSSANNASIESGSKASSRRLLRRRPSNDGGGSTVITGTSRHRSRTQPTNFASRTSMFLNDASKRLADLSTRHKKQVKQTTKERAYWQNDMHLKLQKFAMMNKNLNEEAASRANEVKEIKVLLDKMTNERNALTSQIDTLQARVQLYEGENAEQSSLRQEWESERSQLLNSTEKKIKVRDEVIADLSTRLELAAKTFEKDYRHIQSPRRQIFPHSPSTSRQNSFSGDNTPPTSPAKSNMKADEYLEQVKKSEDVALKAKQSLKVAMAAHSTRERALQSRVEALERELSSC